MWESPGQYGRVDTYANKQHLALTFCCQKQQFKMINAI